MERPCERNSAWPLLGHVADSGLNCDLFRSVARPKPHSAAMKAAPLALWAIVAAQTVAIGVLWQKQSRQAHVSSSPDCSICERLDKESRDQELDIRILKARREQLEEWREAVKADLALLERQLESKGIAFTAKSRLSKPEE